MSFKSSPKFLVPVLLLLIALPVAPQKKAEKACFSPEARAIAERSAKVWQAPDPDYDPVVGYSSAKGPRVGAPRVDSDGLAAPIICTANKDETPGSGTTPKFHCSVGGCG